MMSILTPIIVAVVAAIAIATAIRWAKMHADDLKMADTLMDAFYEKAQSLIRNEDTPDGVLWFIEFLAERSGQPHLARNFSFHVLRSILGFPPTPTGNNKFAHDLSKLRGENAQMFADMVVSALAASAYADPLLSRIYASLIAAMLTRSGGRDDKPSVERTNTAAVEIWGVPA